MLSIKLNHVVAKIVSSVFLVERRENEAIYFNFGLNLAYYVNGYNYNQRRGLHLLYYCYPHSSYIDVFSAITDYSFAKIKEIPKESWKHECSHDSEWRSISVFSDIYFEMAECINRDLRKDKLKEVAPCDMYETNSFSFFPNALFEWVPVKISKNPTDKYGYRKIIEVIL